MIFVRIRASPEGEVRIFFRGAFSAARGRKNFLFLSNNLDILHILWYS